MSAIQRHAIAENRRVNTNRLLVDLAVISNPYPTLAKKVDELELVFHKQSAGLAQIDDELAMAEKQLEHMAILTAALEERVAKLEELREQQINKDEAESVEGLQDWFVLKEAVKGDSVDGAKEKMDEAVKQGNEVKHADELSSSENSRQVQE